MPRDLLDRGPASLPAVALLAALALAAVGVQPSLIPAFYVAVVTPVLWATDVAQHRLPNRFVLPGYPVAAGGVLAQWVHDGQLPLAALVAGLAYLGVFLTMALAGGMGMGDVKLAGVLGLSAGLVGAGPAIATPVVAFLLGGVAAVVALSRGLGGGIPFGPYLLAGYWISLVLTP